MRILQGTPARVTTAFRVGGAIVDAGEVTATVTRDDGTVLAADVAAERLDDDSYAIDLTGEHTAELDALAVLWESPTQGPRRSRVDVVGGFYLEAGAIAELADQDPTRVERVIVEVEERIERYCGRAFVPRYRREVFAGAGTRRLFVERRPVRAVRWGTVDGDAVDVSRLTWSATGSIAGPRVWPAGTSITLGLEVGYDAPPADLVEAAAQAVITLVPQRESARKPANASAMFTEGAVINWAQVPDEDRGRVFGMPDVDAVVRAYAERVPVIA